MGDRLEGFPEPFELFHQSQLQAGVSGTFVERGFGGDNDGFGNVQFRLNAFDLVFCQRIKGSGLDMSPYIFHDVPPVLRFRCKVDVPRGDVSETLFIYESSILFFICPGRNSNTEAEHCLFKIR